MAARSSDRTQTPPLPSLGDWVAHIGVALAILVIIGVLIPH
jgi:hypothetical protein